MTPGPASGPPPAVLVDANDGCLTMARSLVARGVRVHVLAKPSFSFTAHSRGVSGRVLPDIQEAREEWLAELDRIGAEGPAVLLSGSDAATELIAGARERLTPTLRSFESRASTHLRLMDKAGLHTLAAAAGVRVPWARLVDSTGDLEAVAASVEFPCISKPVLGHVGKFVGNHRTRLASHRGELEERVGRALADGVAMLVMEYVPGAEERLEGAVTVRAADGTFPLAYGRRKVRQYPLDFGGGSLHRSAEVPEAFDMARSILDAAGFVGVSILEAKRHSGTGELVLIEVNVRVPQGFGLGDACGADASWRLYSVAAGLPLGSQPPQRDGVQVVVPALELRAARAQLRRGDIDLRGLLRSYRGTRDVGFLDPRDPMPALVFVAQGARRWWARARSSWREGPNSR